jgi:hypothetical protein
MARPGRGMRVARPAPSPTLPTSRRAALGAQATIPPQAPSLTSPLVGEAGRGAPPAPPSATPRHA